jgi:hypothetical protein
LLKYEGNSVLRLPGQVLYYLQNVSLHGSYPIRPIMVPSAFLNADAGRRRSPERLHKPSIRPSTAGRICGLT